MHRLFLAIAFLFAGLHTIRAQQYMNQIVDSATYYSNTAVCKVPSGFMLATNQSVDESVQNLKGYLVLLDKNFQFINRKILPFTFKHKSCLVSDNKGGAILCGTYPSRDSAVLIQFNAELSEEKHATIYQKETMNGVSVHQLINLIGGGFAVIGAYDFQIAGGNMDADTLFIIRYNDNLEKISEWRYAARDQHIRDSRILQTSDGGFAVSTVFELGFISPFDPSDQRSLLMKIDATGAKQWEKVTAGLFKQNGTVYLAASPDHAILQGYSYTQYIDWDYTERSTVTIQKFRENGDSVFTLQLNPQAYDDKYFSAFICDEYGSIYCCGKDSDYSSKTWIFKANSSGDSLWFKNYLSLLPNAGEYGHQHFLDCILNPAPNSLLFFGSIWLKDNSGYSWILGTDSTGNSDTANFVGPAQRLLELEIYPNPSKSEFRVTLPLSLSNNNGNRDSQGILEVMDITGRIIYNIEVPDKLSSIEIPCNTWSRGIYILSLKYNGKLSRTGKVLLN